jgi:predicted nucleic acid-binding protein
MRVFLDANILFFAAKSNGAVRELLHLLCTHRHECWVDDYVVTEARRNLAAKEPSALSELEPLLSRLHLCPAQAPGPELRLVNWLPEKDRTVLAAAIRLRCDALVTGDRAHFGPGHGKVFAGVTIHSPRSLAEQLFGNT